ncbi:MAG: hypothetical protein B1H09_02585 [Gemmatimonadaceae bacterium 4484_173]|nr:MAG: hypothetical protein B1H09_02585 [Gemmatimonadaceae bacterium 4484_173]RKZ03698.1 MAG: hypothetical protein DRQ21_05090 [Candidatus Fermentibacteria bacterium]
MKIYLDCYPCFLRQALSAARRAGGTEHQQLAVLKKTMVILDALDTGANPPEIARLVHHAVKQEISSSDPYREAKLESTKQALKMLPKLRRLIDSSKDPMDTAIRLAIAGNIMDLGVVENFGDLDNTIERVLEQPFAINHTEELKSRLSAADHLLYIADNTGETVFDRAFIERLNIPVVYAVRGVPVLNDATVQDAEEAGLHTVADILPNGSDAPGTILELCSDQFKETFGKAPVVIAKGQGNYESLSDAGSKVFCLLQVKCPVIAEDIGAPVGSIVCRRSAVSSSG